MNRRMPHLFGLRRVPREDKGIAVVAVVLLTAVVTGLVATSTVITVNNLDNSRRDRQSLSALSTSEAGLAQAIQFLRGTRLGRLTCVEPAAGVAPGATCQGAGPSWTSATAPYEVTIDGATGTCGTASNCFKVWIGTVKKFKPNCAEQHATPPAKCYGIYRVHATGLVGSGPGARRLVADVKITPFSFPIGIFSETLSGNGNVGLHHESVFTNGCIKNRQDDSNSGSGFQFEWDAAAGHTVLDLVYDQPTAAHATGRISTSNNSCGGTGSGGAPIHEDSKKSGSNYPCNTTFPYDQDGGGGPLAGTSCNNKYARVDGSGTSYPTSSLFTAADLQSYGYRPRGLTDAAYDSLKSQAQAQGTYNLATSAVLQKLTDLAAAGIDSPVLYWDNGDISLSPGDFPSSLKRALDQSAACTGNSVTIVVSGPGNDFTYQGGNSAAKLAASIFVPDGTLTVQGGVNTIGTVFASVIELGGNPDFYMDDCFVNNPPGATLDATATNWREDDTTDVN